MNSTSSPKNSQDGNRISGRDESSELKIIDEGHVLKMWNQLTHPVHDPAHTKRGDSGADEREGEDGAQVTEEVLLLHGVPRMEDDGG